MTANQTPSSYNDPESDDQEDDAAKKSLLWTRIQAFFILAVVAITIAVLILAVQDRGLAHKALATAQTALANLEHVNATFYDQVQQLSTDVANMEANVLSLQSGLARVKTNATSLQSGLVGVQQDVQRLSSKIQILEMAGSKTRTRTSASASASATPYYHSGAGSLRVGSRMPCAALCWIFVEEVVVLLL